MQYAESKVISRRNRINEKKVDELKKKTDLKVDYQIKSKYVDGSIQEEIKFFNGKVNGQSEFDIASIRKTIRKNEQQKATMLKSVKQNLLERFKEAAK